MACPRVIEQVQSRMFGGVGNRRDWHLRNDHILYFARPRPLRSALPGYSGLLAHVFREKPVDSLYLYYSAPLVVRFVDDSVAYSLCGWTTVTTKDRMNKLSPFPIYTVRGKQYLSCWSQYYPVSDEAIVMRTGLSPVVDCYLIDKEYFNDGREWKLHTRQIVQGTHPYIFTE